MLSKHTEVRNKVLAQETVKLAQWPAGVKPRLPEPKPDTFTTEPISLTAILNIQALTNYHIVYVQS